MKDKQSAFVPGEIVPSSIEYHLFHISRKSRIIYITCLSVAIITLFSLPLVYVDLSISARGWVHTGIEKQSLYAPASGRLEFSGIRSDERVNAGDTILVIDYQALRARKQMLMFQKHEHIQAIKDLRLLVQMSVSSIISADVILQSPDYTSDYISFRQQYVRQQLVMKKAVADYERASILYNGGAIAASEYETSAHIVNQEKGLLDALLLQQRHIWQNSLSTRLSEQERIMADIDQVRQEISKCYLISPISGTIVLSTDVQEGAFVSVNQLVAELSPEGNFVVTAAVSPADIGYLYPGQEVRVAVDAYNYSHWGMLYASITDISDDVITDHATNRVYYRVVCQLESDSLLHKNGSAGRLRKGMTVNCRMMKTRKSLYHLLVRRIDQLFNPANLPDST